MMTQIQKPNDNNDDDIASDEYSIKKKLNEVLLIQLQESSTECMSKHFSVMNNN